MNPSGVVARFATPSCDESVPLRSLLPTLTPLVSSNLTNFRVATFKSPLARCQTVPRHTSRHTHDTPHYAKWHHHLVPSSPSHSQSLAQHRPHYERAMLRPQLPAHAPLFALSLLRSLAPQSPLHPHLQLIRSDDVLTTALHGRPHCSGLMPILCPCFQSAHPCFAPSP